jgi:hypothetical protein
MSCLVRSLAALTVAVAVAVFSWSWTLGTVALTASIRLAGQTTALIMGGTFHPLMEPTDSPAFVSSYLANAVDAHLDPAFGEPVANAVAVYGPEQFFPLGKLTLDKSVAAGLANLQLCLAASADCVFNGDVGSTAPQSGDDFEVFGYSQSAIIASLAKRAAIANYQTGDPATPFMLVANPMRPNGGILERFAGFPTIPILGITFQGASPTDGPQLSGGGFAFPTIDLARQYDALGGDFPERPLNLLATLNALLGYGLMHGETVDVPFGDAQFQGQVGDTTYYMITTDIIPLLQPLESFVPKPILAALDAPLRVIIENAYDRDISPGTPTRMKLLPVHDVVKLAIDLVRSIPVAIDNFTEGVGWGRVLGTAEPGPFGVGGPQLPQPPTETVAATSSEPPQQSSDSDVKATRQHHFSLSKGTDRPPADTPAKEESEEKASGPAAEPDAAAADTAPPADVTDDNDRSEEKSSLDSGSSATPDSEPTPRQHRTPRMRPSAPASETNGRHGRPHDTASGKAA